VVASAFLLASANEINECSVERVQIPVKNLNPGLEGFTIVQLTDIHLYPITQLSLVRKAVVIANSLKPDLIVLTGDYVWRQVGAIFDLAPELAKLNARYGVYSSIGNHDIWAGVDVVKEGFHQARLPLLVNQGIAVEHNGGLVYLAGLDDGWSGYPDLEATLQGAPEEAPVVLLCHEPDLADLYSTDGRVSLQLSGHSHGGQVRLPGRGPFVLPYLGQKYDFGLYNVNGMWLYTNRGLGCISVPFRYNCPPEVTQFTLVGA
jgi:predicted MPP superfamily phosphohydrolase